MEIASKQLQERDSNNNSSPRSNGSCSNNNGGGLFSPATPKPVSRSEPANPYPTTFVQADTSSFKQVVQMLTGSTEHVTSADRDPTPGAGNSSKASIPPIRTGQNKKQGFKLYERRNSLKNGLMISPLVPGFHHTSSFSPRNKPPEILSPSILDFPALVLSPVTPLNEDTFNRSSPLNSNSNNIMEEERAIAEKKFYLHPSPRNSTPRDTHAPPQLLPLFPVTSPRVSGSS